MDENIIRYVKEETGKGTPPDVIRQSLEQSGWDRKEIDDAIAFIRMPAPSLASDTSLSSPAGMDGAVGALPGILDIFGSAWNLYTRRFFVFIGIGIIPVLIFLAAMSVRGVSPSVTAIPMMIAISIVYAVVVMASQFALIISVQNPHVGIPGAYKAALSGIHSFLWISLLTGLCVAGGFIAFIIPGLLCLIWFAFAPYVFVAEGLRGTKALSRSKEYVKGYFWSVVWRLIAPLIAVTAVLFVVGVILGVSNVPRGSILYTVMNNTANLLLIPLVAAYQFFVYSALRQLKGNPIPMP